MTKDQVKATATSVQEFPIVNGQEGKKVNEVLPKDVIRAIAHIWRFTEETAFPAITWGVGFAIASEGFLQGSRAWNQIPMHSYSDTVIEGAILGFTAAAIGDLVGRSFFGFESPYPVGGSALAGVSGAVASTYLGGLFKLFRG